MSLKQVKNQIRSVEKIHKVTKAMEAVSAVKMRKSQERALHGRPYAVAALSILKRVSGSLAMSKHPLLLPRKVKKRCLVVITSDKGLAGSLNSSVLKRAEHLAEESKKNQVVVVAIGKKAREFFSKQGYQVFAHFENLSDEITETETQKIVETITQGFLDGLYDRCDLVYTHFLSTFEQKSLSRVMLPIESAAVKEMVDGIVPVSGKYAIPESAELEEKNPLYLVEPSEEAVLSVLLPALLSVELYHAVLEGKASEHSARMVAMKNASDKASDLGKEFHLQYNRERQAMITREVSEIIGGNL